MDSKDTLADHPAQADRSDPPADDQFSATRQRIVGGGEMGRAIRSHDWQASPLGPIDAWPAELVGALNLMLNSREYMYLAWGPGLTFFHNDAYRPMLGPRVARALGARFDELWADAWETVRPAVEAALEGESIRFEDLQVPMSRYGSPEKTWWSFSFSPVFHGPRVAGVLCITNETTQTFLASRKLRSSQEHLQAALEAAHLATWAVDLRDDHSVRSIEHDRMFGYRDAQVRWTRAMAEQHVVEEDRPTFRQAHAVALETGELAYEARVLGADGVVRWIAPRGKVYRDANGVAVRMTGIVADITERKRREADLEASEARLRALNADLERQVAEKTQARNLIWQLSPELLCVVNDQGFIESSNPAWGQLLGWTEEEVARTHSLEFVHPEDLPKTRLALARAVELGEPALDFENRFRTRSGDWRWMSWIAVPDGGRIYCSARDITQEKARSAALAELTLEHDRLWQTSPDLLLVMDMAGIFRRVNPAWKSILGYEEEDLIGTRFDRFIHPDDIARTELAMADLVGGSGPQVENRYRAKDGSWRSIAWVTAPEGGLVYATGRHVTREREQQAALAAAEDALRQSQKMEAVGQLTGGLAHDFNNLLAGVAGSLEIIHRRLAQGRTDDLDRFVNTAQRGAQRAAALTHRLLAFSRRQTLDPKPTNVNRLLADIEDLIRRTVGPSVTLEVVGAGGLWSTLVDGNQLENAVLNLCINARDAMPHGGRITVETANKWLDDRTARERDLAPGQYVSVSVSDTGTGMTPDVAAKAFEPFFTTKPIGMGTGLGLSMIYGFIRQSGGQVRLYTEPGQGTTMSMYLPRHVGDAVDAEPLPAPPAAARAERGETVLVVDDEAPLRMLMREVLEENGFAALEAEDGRSALAVLQSGARVDLLLSDVGLPGGMNGRQLADAARVTRPGLKVLFVTGYAENAVMGEGQLEPGMAILTKPFMLDDLARKVREIVAA